MATLAREQRRSIASTVDRYDLYQRAVQAADHEVKFADRVFAQEFGRRPEVLREDFCGTALICCEWVIRGKQRCAIGIDLDPEPLEWGREHNLSRLDSDRRKRITLIRADVLETRTRKVDVVAATNFSYFIFKERDTLLRYFKRVRQALRKEGLLMLDLMGGAKCQQEDSDDPRKDDGFIYTWEHHKFDPITHSTICRIHFEFPDGSKLRNAFEYDWRLWTIPELRDVLEDAGYSRADAYWEGTDLKTGEGNGVFTRRESAPPDEGWVAYLAAIR